MNGVYIHYGDDSFRPEAFEPVKNSWHNKPIGGLWSSPVDAERGWKSWCEGEEFNLESLDKHFTFTLKDSARILTIEDLRDLDYIPMLNKRKCEFGPDHTDYWPDFEKIAKNYDAILFNLSKDYRLYWALYGWDCDSLLVLNPDAIREIIPCYYETCEKQTEKGEHYGRENCQLCRTEEKT